MSGGSGVSGGYGALEHSYSSLYYLPEMPDNILVPQLREIAAHEFFHIITPLNIHSEEIQYFDYDNPKMSEHLWLYEGTTEYHAQSVQVKYGFYSAKEFLETMKTKMTEAEFGFNDTLPFTEMSKGCLDTFEKQYPNVYAKGALIGMSLDLLLLHESKGKYGLMNLLNDLSKKYGKDKPFKDNELFDVITALAYPSVGSFLKTYVAGTARLPFKELLEYVGVNYTHVEKTKQFTMGQIEIGYNPETKRLIVSGTKNMNDFGKKMGYAPGDEILQINGKKISPMSFKTFRENWTSTVKEGDKLTLLVMRKTADGENKKVKLHSNVFKSEMSKYHIMNFDANATEEQLAIRKAWLERNN
jgi:predicted metalloprotease with PDZ domain